MSTPTSIARRRRGGRRRWRSCPASPPSPTTNGRDDQPRLVGRAVLPTSTPTPARRRAARFFAGRTSSTASRSRSPSQPVEGFSAIVEGREPGEWLAMPDNGFGAKANSRDFLIRAYWIRPDFKTAAGGTGGVEVGGLHLVPRPQRRHRLPDRQREHGRSLAHRRRHRPRVPAGRQARRPVGRRRVRPVDPPLRRRPVSCSRRRSRCPVTSMSPNNPFLGGPAPATQPNSRGLEGMGIAPTAGTSTRRWRAPPSPTSPPIRPAA